MLQCCLDMRTYDLTQAYEYDPHVWLSNSDTDDKLMEFVRVWGPLYLSGEESSSGMASHPLGYYRAFQRWLRALIDLLAAFKAAEDEQLALVRFVEAEYESGRHSHIASDESALLFGLRAYLGITGNIVDWVKGAKLGDLRVATDFAIQLATLAPMGWYLLGRRERGRRCLEARWRITTLKEALVWMIWYDEFTQHAIVCCRECRQVFRGETAHARKYCSHECAHRATAREWQRGKRAALRSSNKRKQRRGEK